MPARGQESAPPGVAPMVTKNRGAMPALQGLNLNRHDRLHHTTLTLAGEIDLDTAPSVRVMIEDCLREGIRTVDIDLTALTFCDVSGLNAFLAAAALTTAAGGSLYLHHPSPMLIRLLALTGTGFLFRALPLVPRPGAAEDSPAPHPRLLAS